MKANELMIGDWVNVLWGSSPCPTKVNKLEADGSVWVEPLTPDGSVAIQCDASPIPLTAGILEKNGWQYSYKDEVYYSKDSTIYPHSDRPYTLSIRVGLYLYAFPFSYVHELQHALRLCGLDELADNFKI